MDHYYEVLRQVAKVPGKRALTKKTFVPSVDRAIVQQGVEDSQRAKVRSAIAQKCGSSGGKTTAARRRQLKLFG